MGEESTVKLVREPNEFFYSLVNEALGKLRVQPQPQTELYLVNLLQQFIVTENLYARDADGNLREEPLVMMMKDALEETEPTAQSLLFRHIGDVSLYTAGYFQDSLLKKKIDLDYYIDLGGSAYSQVASRSETPSRPLYEDLASNFKEFVEVFADVSDKTTPQTEVDLLRLYENWMETQSDRAARKLRNAGIQPVPISEKKSS